MDSAGALPCDTIAHPRLRIGTAVTDARQIEGRIVADRLPDSFALDRSESEWLLTLLSADELRYIFEGPIDGETPD